jgi:hypothetical protein
MKKILLLTGFVFCIYAAKSQVKFGIKGGINISNFNSSQLSYGSYLQSRTDFNLGIMLSVPISPVFIVQPEMVYSRQGADYTFNPDPQNNEGSQLKYDYLNFPVLIKYQSPKGFFIETGPQVGLLLSAVELDAVSSSNTVDFSWSLGVGYQIPKIHLGVDARYNLGLTEVNSKYYYTVGALKNSVYQFGVFYFFSK